MALDLCGGVEKPKIYLVYVNFTLGNEISIPSDLSMYNRCIVKENQKSGTAAQCTLTIW